MLKIMEGTTIVGIIAAVCTTVAYIPQAVKTIRTRHTKDLSLVMYVVLTIGLVMWMSYGLLLRDWPLIISNLIAVVLTSTILFMIVRQA
jgi:MtN3 and saliva related transmembrane protein